MPEPRFVFRDPNHGSRFTFFAAGSALFLAVSVQVLSIGCAGAEDIPEPTCEDLDEWETEVNELADAILWDVDYEDAQLYIDFSPEKSKRLRENRDSHEWRFLKGLMSGKTPHRQEGTYELEDTALAAKENKNCL